MPKPLAIDLYAGLGGFSEGFLAEGYRCIGFDIERHMYGVNGATGHYATTIYTKYPGQLVLQDVLTLHGSQFKDAACIVASPPCTEYSYMAMPWSRAKQIAKGIRNQSRSTGMRDGNFPDGYIGSRNVMQLNRLFDACFRIQREASEAAGHHIPLIVENVKGAQPWVGRAKANYGSFYLWGDIASIGGRIVRPDRIEFGMAAVAAAARGGKNGDMGGSWFNIAHNTESGVGHNPVSRKVPGFNFHQHENGLPGGSFQSTAVAGQKVPVYSDPRCNGGKGKHLTSPGENAEGVKGFTKRFEDMPMAWLSSKSSARKAASAQIARIPRPLAEHIARIYKP